MALFADGFDCGPIVSANTACKYWTATSGGAVAATDPNLIYADNVP